MMFIIRQSDKDTSQRASLNTGFEKEPKAYNWHVGEARPRLRGDLGFEDVCEIYADGHELEYIRKNYVGIPNVPATRGQTYRGIFAQFIYDHLPTFGVGGTLREGETYHF